MQQRIEGPVIGWLHVRADSAYADRSIGDARIPDPDRVSVVAIVRGEDAVPAPGPEEMLKTDDYLVVVGAARGIEPSRSPC